MPLKMSEGVYLVVESSIFFTEGDIVEFKRMGYVAPWFFDGIKEKPIFWDRVLFIGEI